MSPILLKGCIPFNHEVNYDVLIIVIQGIRQSFPARGNPKVPYERQLTRVPNCIVIHISKEVAHVTISAPKSKHSIADTMIIRFDHVI